MISGQARILVGCQEVPGYGGASTASYKLFEMMQNDGLDVYYLNLITQEEADYLRYMFGEDVGNLRCLANVYTCVLRAPLVTAQPELTDLIRLLSPDRLVGIGWIAAVVMKRAAPERRLIFITAGFSRMQNYIREGKVEDFVSLTMSIQASTSIPRLPSDGSFLEGEAVQIADRVITNADSIMFLFQHFFPSQMGKIHSDVIWFAEWIYKDALTYSCLQVPFDQRDIDILFIASNWSRPEKNYDLVKRIVSRCEGLRVHIVGEVDEQLRSARYHGLVTNRSDLFSIMGRAKAVVSPSLFDAAPGILFETSAMGCNIVASKNCGNWRICHERLLVDPYNLDNFTEKIAVSLSRKYEDNIQYYMRTNSYAKLMNAIFSD